MIYDFIELVAVEDLFYAFAVKEIIRKSPLYFAHPA